ncbi:ATP-binding protein [Paenirhodobacter sp.]|uniref:hybrid sensor histidine kinase/response regulator n=1 Tax=Paenirhodobacter sp. TaxID=1965326 RepID=UPI003B4107EF
MSSRKPGGTAWPVREAWLFGVGACLALLAFAMTEAQTLVLLLSVGGSLMVLAVLILLARQFRRLAETAFRARMDSAFGHDGAATFGTDSAGMIRYQNGISRSRFGSAEGRSLADILTTTLASPDSVLARVTGRATAKGAAQEDITTSRGGIRLAVHRIGGDRGRLSRFAWRIEDLAPGEVGDAGGLPRLSLSKNGAVVSMNPALRALVGDKPTTLEEIVTDLPLRPGEEHELISVSGPIRCFVTETEGQGDRRSIFLMPIAAGKAVSHDPTAFDSLPVALIRLTADGRVMAANNAARALLGDIACGASLSDLFEGLGRPVADWVTDARAGRTDRRPEVLRARGLEREVFVHVSLNRVVEEGRAGLIAVLSDATQLKKLEEQFVQSQKMQAIGQLAGGVAHDFNNLLTAISGHCDLLMLRHDKGDPDYADLDQISQNANRAAALVRQLLAFSRKQTLNPQVIDMRDTLSDLTHLLNRLVGEKVKLTLLHDPDLRPIRADKRQIEQVIMNLVVNARDAMPGGGDIRIETENLTLTEDLKRDRVSVPKGDYVCVRVTDEGTGIAPDTLAKIFEPFFTTKRTGEGTGLGLSTAYGIVKQTGGYIFCDSELGHGSTFILLLPTYDRLELEEPAPQSVSSAEAMTENASATVLLVEDEAPVRAFASRALRLRGYSVFEAENAEDALRILEDPSLAFDIFVSDVIMPGMDGPSWVGEARKTRPDTPVVFISGYAEDVFRGGLPPIPRSAFLPKPFSLSELTATVQNTLGR